MFKLLQKYDRRNSRKSNFKVSLGDVSKREWHFLLRRHRSKRHLKRVTTSGHNVSLAGFIMLRSRVAQEFTQMIYAR